MNVQEILSRLTGISTPFGGVTWTGQEPSEPEVAKARRVIAAMEDRRVLFTPPDAQILSYCAPSVQEIRELLTKELGELGEEGILADNLRAMRAACRKFLDQVDLLQRNSGDLYNPENSSTLFIALGELRNTFGIHIALIAAHYSLNVEDELATILPAKDVEDQTVDSAGPP